MSSERPRGNAAPTTTRGAQAPTRTGDPNGHGGSGAKRSAKTAKLIGAAIAELLGTFILVFVGTAAVLAIGPSSPGGDANLLIIALAFGLALLVGVYAFGHVSAAHLNPAVTIALVSSRRFPAAAAPAYIGAQIAGAVLASLAAWAIFGDDVRSKAPFLGATSPGEDFSTGTALLAEVIMTFVLVLVVKAVAVDDRADGPTAGLAIGFTVAAGILAVGPVSGASFNPARTLGPALVSGQFTALWIYIVGPIVGGILAALLYESFIKRGSPPDVDDPEYGGTGEGKY
jgi:glycerol uptake facilitator protein/aquaporin Z/aquaporin NIP